MDELSRERLAFDPIYKQAQKVANALLSRTFIRSNEHKELARKEIEEYRSKTQKLQFLDALRREMLLWMERHRPDCSSKNDPEKCSIEVRYADVVRIIQDELELLEPSIASRSATGSFTREEADAIMKLFNEMRDSLQSMENNIQTGQELTYDMISEELNELALKLSMGKKDFGSVFLGRINDAAIKKGIDLALLQPFVEEVKKIVDST